jgi:hypothetical protein
MPAESRGTAAVERGFWTKPDFQMMLKETLT